MGGFGGLTISPEARLEEVDEFFFKRATSPSNSPILANACSSRTRNWANSLPNRSQFRQLPCGVSKVLSSAAALHVRDARNLFLD
jgi:hypothetical protein